MPIYDAQSIPDQATSGVKDPLAELVEAVLDVEHRRAVDYKLAPEYRWRVQIAEGEFVVRWLFEHAAERGVDLAAIVLGGVSAGSHLTCTICLKLRDESRPTLALQMPLYRKRRYRSKRPPASKTSRVVTSTRPACCCSSGVCFPRATTTRNPPSRRSTRRATLTCPRLCS